MNRFFKNRKKIIKQPQKKKLNKQQPQKEKLNKQQQQQQKLRQVHKKSITCNIENMNVNQYMFGTKKINYAFVFVCHSEELINSCFQKFPDSNILYVGNQKLNMNIENKNIIIAKNLEHNIEHYPFLLSFTAWYAIIKNNLYSDKDYLCILEYDVFFNSVFPYRLNHYIERYQPDCISFIRKTDGFHFKADICINNIDIFCNTKYPEMITWYPTTNHCMKRKVLSDFVDWYYPKCIDELLVLDSSKISWYHERLFNVFLYEYVSKHIYMGGLKHKQLNSHKKMNNLRK